MLFRGDRVGSVSSRVSGLGSIGMMQNRRKSFALETFSGAREGFGSYVEIWADLFDRERSWSAKEY